MPTTSAYEQLQKDVQDLAAQFAKAQAELNALVNDPTYVFDKQALANPSVKNDLSAWMMPNGTLYMNSASHDAGVKYVANQEAKIKLKQLQVDDLKIKYANAQKAVTNFENSSPVIKAQLEDEKNKTLFNNILIVVGVITVIGLAIWGVWYYNKKRKGAALAAAAV